MSVVQTIVFGLLTSNFLTYCLPNFIVPQTQNNTSHVQITLAHKLKSHKQNELRAMRG